MSTVDNSLSAYIIKIHNEVNAGPDVLDVSTISTALDTYITQHQTYHDHLNPDYQHTATFCMAADIYARYVRGEIT